MPSGGRDQDGAAREVERIGERAPDSLEGLGQRGLQPIVVVTPTQQLQTHGRRHRLPTLPRLNGRLLA